ncbi:TniB family NTP-binding protein [Mesorhizobium sp. M0676]
MFLQRAKQALDRLNLLVGHPRGTRMPSVAIYGDSGMGKTMILEKFCDNNPSRFEPTTGVQAMPRAPFRCRDRGYTWSTTGTPRRHCANGASGVAAYENGRRPGSGDR